MGLLNKLFGYRWSLYVCTNGNELRYAMHGDSVMGIVGYVMGYYESGQSPVSPWSLHLNFNKTHRSFELTSQHFGPNEQLDDLVRAVSRIDPDWRSGRGDPVFLELPSRRSIKIADPVCDRIDVNKVSSSLEALLTGKPQEQTFFDIMDRVFGRTR